MLYMAQLGFIVYYIEYNKIIHFFFSSLLELLPSHFTLNLKIVVSTYSSIKSSSRYSYSYSSSSSAYNSSTEMT